MSLRTWLYGQLTDPTDFEGRTLVGNRVFAKKSMRSSEEEHPYIVYKLGNQTDDALSEESTANHQYMQIWIHDYADEDTADYMRIDDVIKWLKRDGLLIGASSPDDHVITIQFLETSQDLNDETLGTVFRYMRFVAIMGE